MDVVGTGALAAGGKGLAMKKAGEVLFHMTGGLISTVPTNAEEAKQMGMDLVTKMAGKELSRQTKGLIKQVPTNAQEAKQMGMDLVMKKAGKELSHLTGGVIKEVPASPAEAKKMLDSMTANAKRKAGEVLSKLTGGAISTVPTNEAEAKTMLDSMMAIAKASAGEELSKVSGGVVNSVPTNEADAKRMLDSMIAIAKKKADEVLSQLTGGLITAVPTNKAEAKRMLDSMMANLAKKGGKMLSSAEVLIATDAGTESMVGGVQLEFSTKGFMLKYERGTSHSPNVQSMVDALAAGSTLAGSKLSGLKLPIAGAAEMLERVQLDKLRLDLEGDRVTHAEVSVKLKGENATQRVAKEVELTGASVDVLVERPVGGAVSWTAEVRGSWIMGSSRVVASLSTDGQTTKLVGTASKDGLSVEAAVKALSGGKWSLPSALSSLRVSHIVALELARHEASCGALWSSRWATS